MRKVIYWKLILDGEERREEDKACSSFYTNYGGEDKDLWPAG